MRLGLRETLAEAGDIDICGEAVDGRDALAKAERLKPDFVLMDVGLPVRDGIEATRQIRGNLPETRVVTLSHYDHDHPEVVREALKAGASKHVFKLDVGTDLLSTLRKLQDEPMSRDVIAAAPPIALEFSSATGLNRTQETTPALEREIHHPRSPITTPRRDWRATEENQKSKTAVLVCRAICIGFALIETFSQLRFINEDGVSYLDMSDALIRHNWHLLINPIWSPLYPFLIGLVTWFTRPSAQWEVPLVHAMNLLLFLGALASFEFFLRRVISVLRPENGPEDANSGAPLPAWAWQVLGYSLFAWTTVGMIWAPRMITPDLCVAALVYLDAGLLLSLRDRGKWTRTCLLLGVTLGLGYLAKAILFPMAFLFMVLAFFMMGEWRKAIRPLAVTFLLFCAISAPLLISMSHRVGRPSYSEAGNLNYVWHVNGFNPYVASASPSGPPSYLKHPMTLAHRNPDVFIFKEPTAYTYPPRQDMEYWSAGAIAAVNAGDQLRAVANNLRVLLTDAHIMYMCLLIVGALIFVLLSPNSSWRFKKISRSWPLLLAGIAGPFLYLLISVEPRYIAPFLLLVLLGLFPGIVVRNSKDAEKRAARWTIVFATFVMVLTGLVVVYHLAGYPRAQRQLGEEFLQVGESLNRTGVQPGQDVAIIGDSSDGCRWARMARVRIVAQILRGDVADFWRADPGVKADVYDAFAKAGANAVIAEQTPPPDEAAEWQRLGDSHYYVHFVAPIALQSSYNH